MSFFNTIESGSLGIKPTTVDIRVQLVTTAEAEADAVKGATLAFDTLRTSADTTNSRPGKDGSIWTNVVTPVTAYLSTGWNVLCLEGFSKGSSGKVRFKGQGQGLAANGGAGIIPTGSFCTAVNSEVWFETDPAISTLGDRHYFMLDEASAAADDGTTLRRGWFNGEGFSVAL